MKTIGRWLCGSISAVACLLSGEAQAEALRCGDKLARVGDSTYQVRSVCGVPDATDRRVETRTVRHKVRGPCFKDKGRLVCERVEERSIEIVIDEWVYDFGRRRLVRYLTFENGRLVHVLTGGYGSSDDD